MAHLNPQLVHVVDEGRESLGHPAFELLAPDQGAGLHERTRGVDQQDPVGRVVDVGFQAGRIDPHLRKIIGGLQPQVVSHGRIADQLQEPFGDFVKCGGVDPFLLAVERAYDRCSEQGFHDYFSLLTGFEPRRAAQFGIRHYTWICLNPKETEDLGLARAVLQIIPEFLDQPNVLGVGEIGLNKNSRNEREVLEWHIQLAADHNQLILVHTPHLEDKRKGTQLIIDALRNHSAIQPERVIIDHVEEVSDPLATPRAAQEMRRRGHSPTQIQHMVFDNPVSFLNQCPKFEVAPPTQPPA